MSPNGPRHGTTSGYAAGCHEACCRRAKMLHQKKLRLDNAHGIQYLVDATGTARRIHALQRIGWSARLISAEAGWTPNASQNLANLQKVNRRSAATIKVIYDKLSMTPGPSVRARKHAERMGWPPPLAWDDDLIDDPNHEPDFGSDRPSRHDVDPMVVERIVSGDYTVPTTSAEKFAVVAEFLRRGRPLKQLEDAGWKPDRYISRLDGAA